MKFLPLCLFCLILNAEIFGQDSFKSYVLEDSSINVLLPSEPEDLYKVLRINNNEFKSHLMTSKKISGRKSMIFIIRVIDFSNRDSSYQNLDFWENYLIKTKTSNGAKITECKDKVPLEFPYVKELHFVDEQLSGLNRVRIFISNKKIYSIETLSFKRLAKSDFKLIQDEQVFYDSFRFIKKN